MKGKPYKGMRARILLLTATCLCAVSCATTPYDPYLVSLTFAPQEPIPPTIIKKQSFSLSSIKTVAVLAIEPSDNHSTETFTLEKFKLPHTEKRRYIADESAIATACAEEILLSRFDVADRRNVDRILAEQELQLSAAFDQGSAAKVGRLIGCDAVLIGKINYAYSSVVYTYNDKYAMETYVPSASLSLKLISVETGEIILSTTIERNAYNYLKKETRVTNRQLAANPQAFDPILGGSTIEAQVSGIIKKALRECLSPIL